MSTHSSALVLVLAGTGLLTACAHQRPPTARCTGPLERINVTAPVGEHNGRSAPQAESTEAPSDEEHAP